MENGKVSISTFIFLLIFIRHNTSSPQPTQPVPTPNKPNCGCGSELQQKIINSILGMPHNKHISPPPGNTPLSVRVNLAVLNIISVDESTHLWKTNLFVRQEWNDSRLQYSSLLSTCPKFRYLQLTTNEMIDSFWKPNLFFPDEVDGKIVDTPHSNRVLRVFPNGHVFFSVQTSVTLYCSGLGSRRGEIVCTMQLYPFGPEVDTMDLSWATINNPVQINRTSIILPNHVVEDIDVSVTNTISLTGTYSTLLARFHFQRKACLM